ncbi:hypothetical protein Q4511_15650 [Paracoccus sp. 1_MG-2023]|uniref:hypothetical protein n=1 Tax=unclassified Paracoccus (in: a-proteobacteria) TaxID=2688777 RepID=UPI001C0865FE|nr:MULTISPECIES: hypothetical protein [unclassified Paracoccus (in: a-proteobacteria)]MBU2958013.1 hypothetical protein [Paracoccus sp. C2R09]MDO6670352.1 hypothetical protein [Paracoccus sp. 1_MG-2023]
MAALTATALANDRAVPEEQSVFEEPQCYRPAPPDRIDFEVEAEFYEARESYYRQSSVYIGCIDQWIDDARATYTEMFQLEAEAYLEEREEIVDELRQVGSQDSF